MAVDSQLTLIVNPGSSSRKYGLYRQGEPLAFVIAEQLDNGLHLTVKANGTTHHPAVGVTHLAHVTENLFDILSQCQVECTPQQIQKVVLRIVAPSGYFVQHRLIDDEAIRRLKGLAQKAPLHITSTLQEAHVLHKILPHASIAGISDSAFHATKPDRAWNYGLPIQDSDVFEIKRFGYHGISASAVVRLLHQMDKLPRRLIICHLGSGASVTAVNNGKSIDNTMGYSPLEGLVMATRSGTIDAGAYATLKHELHMDDTHMQRYLNRNSGLLGLSGISEGVKQLLEAEAAGNPAAGLALETYVYAVQKAIGQMMAALQGADMIVLTGTVGERAADIRSRILRAFHFADFYLDEHANTHITQPAEATCISRLAQSKPVFVVPADEMTEMLHLARRV